MSAIHDGPSSPHFRPLPFISMAGVSASAGLSEQMSAALAAAPSGSCVCWGIPFEIGDAVILTDALPKNPSGKLLKRELRLPILTDVHSEAGYGRCPGGW